MFLFSELAQVTAAKWHVRLWQSHLTDRVYQHNIINIPTYKMFIARQTCSIIKGQAHSGTDMQ